MASEIEALVEEIQEVQKREQELLKRYRYLLSEKNLKKYGIEMRSYPFSEHFHNLFPNIDAEYCVVVGLEDYRVGAVYGDRALLQIPGVDRLISFEVDLLPKILVL